MKDIIVCRRLPMYAIFPDGTFYNMKTEKSVRPIYNEREQDWKITLIDKMGTRRSFRAAELMAETFYGLHDDDFDVEYIDGDSRHLDVDNLRWVRRDNPNRLYADHKTAYILVVETGELFDNIYDCSNALNSSIKSIKNCLKYPYLMNHSGYHLHLIEK